MPRPTNKQELLDQAQEQFEALMKLIDSMSAAERDSIFDFSGLAKKEAHWERDKNLRDVLIHLSEWHQLLFDFVESNSKGELTPFLPAPYTWKNYGELNVEFWRKHQSTCLDDALATLHTTHERVLDLIGQFTTDELFVKKHFPWTGTTSLGAYCVSSTSSHYDWAKKKLNSHLKSLRTQKA